MPGPLVFQRVNPPRSPQWYVPGLSPADTPSPSAGGWRPGPNALFNSAHPSATGLVALIPLNEGIGSTIHQIAAQAGAGVPSTFSTSGSPAWDPDGSGLVCLNADSQYVGTLSNLSFSMGEFTMMAIVGFSASQPGVSGGYSTVMAIGDGSSNGFGMYVAGTGEGVYFGYPSFFPEGSPSGSYTALDSITAGNEGQAKLHGSYVIIFCVASTKRSIQQIWMNGMLYGSASSWSVTNTATVARFMYTPNYSDSRYCQGTAQMFAIWKRALGGDEIAELSNYPYGLVLPKRRLLVTKSFVITADLTATAHTKSATLGRKVFTQLDATASTKQGALNRAVATAFDATAAEKQGVLTVSITKTKQLAAQMLQRAGALAIEVFDTIHAVAAQKAGVLSATLVGSGKTFDATAAQKEGSLEVEVAVQFDATAAQKQGKLTLIVETQPIPPVPTPVTCPTIVPSISHVETCENTGS